MDFKISIYLAGSIKKGHERSDESFWTDADMLLLRKNLSEYEISFLNPAFRSDDLSDQRSVFGRDMTQVFCSDVVFVDARDRRGLGVGAEMMWAKFHKIPIVTLAPLDSHYNKSKTTLLNVAVENWVHPFVESLSDAIVENLSEGGGWIRKFVNASAPKIKDLEWIELAMQHYLEAQLPHDEPMKALITANPKLQKRIWESKNEQNLNNFLNRM
ncbi:MAG TPA: hypothetical protein VLG76_00735 [Rhabdochlamydiaceae bacterium]|nr:hypothetical protein [Rhabdochlamydiaceae bacterium]